MCKLTANNSLINLDVNQYLKNVIKTKSFATGYIFYGSQGVGKKQTAWNFIAEIFKQYSSSHNIEEKIINNNHSDFLLIKPDNFIRNKKIKTKNSELPKKSAEIIKIEQIRSIKTFLSQKSIESEKKIVLIIDAHLLNESASNCLLKTLEEPSNGIFILITSKLNLLLDTIKSRCQIIKFKSLSSKQLEHFFKDNLDSSLLDIYEKIDFQDLVNSCNGSPEKILNNIKFWNKFSVEIISKLEFPLKNNLEILKISKLISEELEVDQQIYIINLIQQIWWRKTKNENLIKSLEILKTQIKNSIQPRLAWEVNLLKIAMELL